MSVLVDSIHASQAIGDEQEVNRRLLCIQIQKLVCS
jgi:hypothetical protein